MIIVLAALAAFSAGGIALAESRDRPRRRADRVAQTS